jgi:hypothetical protein
MLFDVETPAPEFGYQMIRSGDFGFVIISPTAL